MRRRGRLRDAQSSGRPEYPAHLGHVSACQGRSREAGGASRPLTGRGHGLNTPNSGRPIAHQRHGKARDSTPGFKTGAGAVYEHGADVIATFKVVAFLVEDPISE